MSIYSISGLASGIDTRELIAKLMELEREPIKLLEDRCAELQVQMDAWRDVNRRLLNLQNRAADLRSLSLFDRNTAVSSNSEVFTATASTAAAPGTYQVRVLSLAQAHIVGSMHPAEITAEGTADADTSLALEGQLCIDGVVVSVETNDSLKSVAAKINDQEDLHVTASIIDNRLVLTREETGAEEMEIASLGDGNQLALNLGLLVEREGEYTANTLKEASAARVEINGLVVERSQNILDDILAGVTLSLVSLGEGKLTVSRDDQAVITAVKDFVDQYNSTYQFLKEKTAINLDTGVQGHLYGEHTVTQFLFGVRRLLTDTVPGLEGPFDNLSAIGIVTTAWNSGEPEGTIKLDENKLREALAQDREGVEALLRGDGGVAVRLENYLNTLTRSATGVIDIRRQGMETLSRRLNQQIESMEQRLEQREAGLKQQFVALEKALGTMINQGSWLENQLRSLSGLVDF